MTDEKFNSQQAEDLLAMQRRHRIQTMPLTVAQAWQLVDRYNTDYLTVSGGPMNDIVERLFYSGYVMRSVCMDASGNQPIMGLVNKETHEAVRRPEGEQL